MTARRIGLVAALLALELSGCSALLSFDDADLVDGGAAVRDAGGDGGRDGGDAGPVDGGDGGEDGGVGDAARNDGPACEMSNDTQATATLIAMPITLASDLCRHGDHDFYRFSRALGGAPINVRVDFDARFGDVDLRLYNQLGQVIAQSASPGGSSEEINRPTVFGASFFVEVYDDAEQSTAPYSMTLSY